MDQEAGSESRGAIWVACGAAYVAAAARSARSLLEHSPGLGTHLFTDRSDSVDPVFGGVTVLDTPHRRSKVDCLARTPFRRTLYLDADTRVVADISEIFELLDRFDLAFAHAHRRYHPNTTVMWRHRLPESFPQPNTGVLLYRDDPRTLRVLGEWGEHYRRAGFAKDQVTLRELLWLSDLRVHVLPPEYNLRYAKYLDVWDRQEAVPKILHYREFKDDAAASEPRRWRLGRR